MSDQEELENQVCVLIAEKVVLRDLVERAHHLALCVFKGSTKADYERARHNAAVLANAIEHARQSAAQVPPPIASTAEASAASTLCEDCPPICHPDVPTRCLPCPRRPENLSGADLVRYIRLKCPTSTDVED